MLSFSIIIPVYNAEKTLERCLTSINKQTLTNYEVILVDDGSTDCSLSICKKYEKTNDRYCVIHQKNSGPSVARNVGLSVAKGEWVCFVDSDDTVEDNYLQSISDAITDYDADVVFIGYNKICEKGNVSSVVPDEICSSKIKSLIELSENDIFGYTWVKSFRKAVIQKKKFDPLLNLFEDEVFACQAMENCEKIGVVKKAIYNYYVSSGSLMGRTYDDYCQKCDKVYMAWKQMLNGNLDGSEVLRKKANSFVSRSYYYAFERPVSIRRYFRYLKDAGFFQEHTKMSSLDQAVVKEKYFRLWLSKVKYRTKVAVASAVQRSKNKLG